MDEASKLVSELQAKLTDLDQKVWQYRRDMGAEFEKYAKSLLRDVPKDVSETVSKVMTEKFKGHNAISVFPIESCAPGTGTRVLNGAGSEDAARPHVVAIPNPLLAPEQEDRMVERPRSPHEREKEFQGVFTPSYLPLLDSNSRNERRSSYDHPASPPPLDLKGKGKEETMGVDATTDTRSLSVTPEATRPPTPRRKNTDEQSVVSDASDGLPRRSALRRSSSATKGSPRHVRFDFAGEEVLPTASPQPMSMLDGESTGAFMDDSDDEGLEQIEDVEHPPPKRISSSQALRALSRSPLVDDGTEWTEVRAPPDGSASIAASNGASQESSSDDLFMGGRGSRSRDISHEESSEAEKVPESGSGNNGNREVEETSDDEMPEMRPRATAPASMLSPPIPADINSNRSPTASTRPSKTFREMDFGLKEDTDLSDLKFANTKDDHDEEDDLFDFDENVSSPLAKSRKPQYLSDEEAEEDDEKASPSSGDSASSSSPTSKLTTNTSAYATSPARGILRPAQNDAAPIKTVIGSYNGKPLKMDIVSPEIHAQAAAAGPFESFVGSVKDGREASVRGSARGGGAGSFGGVPRSFTERMMMEDIAENQNGQQMDDTRR